VSSHVANKVTPFIPTKSRDICNAACLTHIQIDQGAGSSPQAEASGGCPHRYHYRMAADPNDLITDEGVVGRSYLEPYSIKTMRYQIPALQDFVRCSRADVSRRSSLFVVRNFDTKNFDTKQVEILEIICQYEAYLSLFALPSR
jgi:hypothetical protein